jgi:hypothetical protein
VKPRVARAAIDWLRTQASFQDLAHHSDRLTRLQADVDRCAPVKGLAVHALDDTVLVLTTRGAALAAKVRQFEPSLVAGLSRSGWKVSRIRIRPQPSQQVESPATRPPVVRDPVPESTLAALRALRDSAESARLKEALTNLLQHQVKR